MKRLLSLILLLSVFLSGCGALNPAAPAADATATISVEDIRATADAMVYDMLTQTQAAMPTNTAIPPTETPLPTATFTVVPTNTVIAEETSAVILETATAAPLPTSTTAAVDPYACTKQPLLSWTGDSAKIKITNNVKNTNATVFFCVTTPYGEAGYITGNAGSSVQIPYGYVTATAWITGAKDFNVTTGFEVKTPDTRQIIIENGNIYYRAGCAPGC